VGYFGTLMRNVLPGWKGRYRIEGPAFVYIDRDTGRSSTILGYPTQKLQRVARGS
jgi:hypothetical protein